MKTDIENVIKPVVNELGYELWGVEYITQRGHALLRVYIDKSDGILIDDCEKVSRQLSLVLDVEEPVISNYLLEVSSPGIPRPLMCQSHYLQYVGKVIQLKLYHAIRGSKKYAGVLKKVDDNQITMVVADEEMDFSFSQIVKANLIGE